MLMYDTNRSALTIVTNVKYKLQIKFAMSPSERVLRPSQQVLALAQ